MGYIVSMQWKKKKKWIPPAMTEGYLEQVTIEYLQQYMPSAEQLRRVLLKKLHKNWQMRGDLVTMEEKHEGMDIVEKVLQSQMEQGRVQDDKVAQIWTEHLQHRGSSRLQITQKLRQKGISAEIIEQSIQSLADEDELHELASAIQYAKRRRLGPFSRSALLLENEENSAEDNREDNREDPTENAETPEDLLDTSTTEHTEHRQNGACKGTSTFPKRQSFSGNSNPQQKHMSAMLRAGHKFDVVKQIFACQTIEEVENLLLDP